MSLYAVTDPSTGEVVEEYPTATAAQIEDAITAAAAAHREWGRATTVAERAASIRRVARLHTERKDELARIINREMGKRLDRSAAEVEFSAAIYNYYADNAEKFLADEPITLLDGDGSALIRRSPVGVLLGIMPWNYPYYQVARFAGPNLTLGNTILLKHAPQCPESAAALQQIFLDAGFPHGAYVNIYATNEQVAEIIADPRVQGVSLTGSERAGAAVAEIAGRNLKKVVLELGGSDPFIVLSSDNLEATVDAAVGGRFENTGQACNAAKRFIVADDIYDEFLDKFTTRVLRKSADLGPLSSTAAAERLENQIGRAVAAGADLVTEGRRDGAYYPPGCSPTCPPTTARNCSARSPRSTGWRGRTRPSSWPTTRRSASAPTCTPPTRTRPAASRTGSRREWCSSTRSAPRGSNCRSAASSDPASAVNSAATASMSSSTRN